MKPEKNATTEYLERTTPRKQRGSGIDANEFLREKPAIDQKIKEEELVLKAK